MSESRLRYVLITPAWNEEAHLDRLIRSVAEQTLLPVRWVIVSDGSTDRTDLIVRSAATEFPWISLLRLERTSERNFAGKAHAVNAGYTSLAGVDFEFVGNLDADMTVPPDYYEFLSRKFVEMPELGVAGTPFVDDEENPERHSYDHGFADLSHVSGACQFFRRRCFDEIGGYTPVKQGAIDWVAVTTARMRGWTTRTFLERTSFHHRTMGTADRSVLRARFHHGQKDFLVGGHPLWQVLRGVFQMTRSPFMLGGLCLIGGYFSAWAVRKPSPVPTALREFHRREQMDRLRRCVRRRGSRRAAFRQKAVPARPLRICHIAYTFYDSDNRVMRYVQALTAEGHQVDVIALRHAGERWRDCAGGVRRYQIQRRSRTEQRALTYLLKILWFWFKSTILVTVLQLRRRYDVVHVHNVPDFLVFAAWLPKLMGARVILDIHDLLPEFYAGKFDVAPSSAMLRRLTTVERAGCSFADHVLVANHLWHDKLTSRSVPASKCTALLNYPDCSVFKPAEDRRRSADSSFLFLYPGSLNHHQGVDIALRAFALARPHMPAAVFHIYGGGPALTGLVRLAQDLGLDTSVRFMESVSLQRIAQVMASAGAGVVPKRADGFGNEAFSTKILEFMACETPVIVSCTRIDAHYFNHEMVNFFEPGSVKGLADVMVHTYRGRNGQRHKVLAAKEFATRHSWEIRRADYLGLIDALVARANTWAPADNRSVV